MDLPDRLDHLRRLWVLRETIRAGSVRKAAVRIKVTPSAVSQSLKTLEQSLGKPVMVRSAKAFALTAEGLNLLSQAEPLLVQLEMLEDRTSIEPLHISHLTFGSYESLAIQVMPLLVKALQKKFPSIALTALAARSDALVTRVRSGELCMALIVEGPSVSRLNVTSVGSDRLGFYISPTHLPERDFYTIIREMKWGSISTPLSGTPTYLSRFMGKIGDIGKPSFLSDSLQAVRSLTAAGTIVGLLPTQVAESGFPPLVEITPPPIIDSNACGYHRVLLISGSNCDQREHDLLAEICKSLLENTSREAQLIG